MTTLRVFCPPNFCVVPCYVKCASNTVYYSSRLCKSWHPKEHKHTLKRAHTVIHSNHKAMREHSHPHSHHCLWKRILKVCFTKLRRGGRIFSFSSWSGRCVFQWEREREREWSSAGQVISLSQWESTPWNSPREAGKAAFIIFLLYYCQNLLCFTFCCRWPFFPLHTKRFHSVSVSFVCRNVACFCSLFIHYTPFTEVLCVL